MLVINLAFEELKKIVEVMFMKKLLFGKGFEEIYNLVKTAAIRLNALSTYTKLHRFVVTHPTRFKHRF